MFCTGSFAVPKAMSQNEHQRRKLFQKDTYRYALGRRLFNGNMSAHDLDFFIFFLVSTKFLCSVSNNYDSDERQTVLVTLIIIIMKIITPSLNVGT